MRKDYGRIFVLATIIAVLAVIALPCLGGEEDEPRGEHRRHELSGEFVDRVLERMAQDNPDKAKELIRLRKENPEKFKAEFREILQKFAPREHMGGPPHPEMEGPGRGDHGRGGGGRDGGSERGRRMREQYIEEHLEWLGKNYPEDANKLAELKEKNPEHYPRRLGISIRKYHRIIDAEKENPELAEVLKENMELGKEQYQLVRKIAATEDEAEKEELVAELKEVVNRKFDLIIKRKQIAYEQLFKKLEELKKEIEESKASVEKWNDAEFKSEKVKARLEELLSGKHKFRWN